MTNIRLNDAQLVLLSAASQREDGSLLPLLPGLADDAPRMNKTIEQLIKKGLAAEKPGTSKDAVWRADDDTRFGVFITDAGLSAINVDEEGDANATPPAAPEPQAPARQTKRAMLIEMLRREGGASIEQIVAATGWLPHTSHAALTGLRKAGMTLASEKVDGTRRYRIVEPA